MPIFLDTHHGSEVAFDRTRDFLRDAAAARCDAFGVRPLELYCGDDGRVFFVVAAPDEACVRQRHAALGVTCQRIRTVESGQAVAADELGETEKTQVRHMIADEHAWPAEIAS
jgi:hypothetical protein